MAIYSFNRKITKRTSQDGKIRNAVFAAAYYRAENRTCHKTQETKDFTDKKAEVIYKDCLLPSDAPAWATKLRGAYVPDEKDQYSYDKTGAVFSDFAWNLIEHIEKRYDSQIYIRDIVAIPIELNQEQAIELAREFAQNELAVEGSFCEVVIHWDLVNPHVHFMRPAFRTFTDEGFSKKVRPTQAELKAELLKHRKRWAEYANHKLAMAGFDVRIDHRSYKDRGIDLLPTIKVGKATYMTGTEHQELRIAENQCIRALNYQKIETNPEILVKKIGQEHQSLIKEDVHQELSRYLVNEQVLKKIKEEQEASREKIIRSVIGILKSEYTIFNERTLKAEVVKQTDDNETYQQIVDRILNSEGIFNLGLGEDGRHYYVTREVFQLELGMIQGAEKLNQKSTFLVSPHDIEKLSLQYALNSGQQLALRHITQGKNIALVRGMAGTGKTYLLKPAREIWERAGFKVHGVAFLGRAAAGLESDAGINSKTIDRFLSGVGNGVIKLSNKDIIVMDEMGMTSLDHAHALVKIANAAGAKLVALGDIEQTQSTRRGAPGKALIDTVGCVVLDEIIRQKLSWQAKATLNMEMQQTAQGLDVYQQHGCVTFIETRVEAMTLAVRQWFDQWQVDHDELKNHIMAAFKNETVLALNLSARKRLAENGILDKGTEFKTTSGKLLIAIGERIVFGENNDQIAVKNGDFGIVEKIDDKIFSVRLDDRTLREFSIERYNHINYGYAATVHKLQGYTGNYTQLYVDSRGFDRHLFLVGASRHRYNLSIIADHENFKDYADLKEIVSREGLKDHVFDFPAAFAIRRGFDEQRITQRVAEFVRQAKEKLYDSVVWLLNYQQALDRQSNKNLQSDITLRRQRACDVADFCDRRIEIAQKVEAMRAMPGVSLSLGYQTPPKDDELRDKTLSLYLKNDTIHFAVRNKDGIVIHMTLSDEQFTQKKYLKNIKNVLYDDAQVDKLNSRAKETLFDVIAQYGYSPIDEEEKIKQQRDIYQKQLQNSGLARTIQKNYEELRVAMDRNRISREAIEKSIAFGDKHDEIKIVAQNYKLNQFYNPAQAHQIIKDFRLYYGHMIFAIGDGKDLNGLINELKHQAHQHRYNNANEILDVEMRPMLNVIKQYLDLDYEVAKILMNSVNSLNEMKSRLLELTVERNTLANQILIDSEKYQAVVDYIGADQNRMRIHQVGHNARELVKRFAEMQTTTTGNPNLHKQLLAHKIKSRPKRYNEYIYELLSDGWKQVNLENWHFERRRTLSTQSKAFKESYRLVRRYINAALVTSEAWKAALKRRDLQSKNTAEFIRRAQGLSIQRDRLASSIVCDLEIHVSSLSFERVDIAKLTSHARSYNMQRYLHALYYHEASAIDYTAAEHYLREVKGLVGADLSEVRYHNHVMLPDQTKTQPAFLIPARDEQGNITAELIYYLNPTGEYITQTAVRGEAKGSVIAIQKTENINSFYITDNFVDGKSIAIGNRKANVYMSLENYKDLENITWIFKQHDKVPTHIILTTDNFEKTTEKLIYELCKPLSDSGITLLMAKGHLEGHYTHVSINEAMVTQDKLQGENYIQHIGIQVPKNEKLTVKEKVKRTIRANSYAKTNVEIFRPKKQTALSYYITLTKEQTDAIKAYFNSMEQLMSHDSYQKALIVAVQANRVYDSLTNEIRKINHHPQKPNRIFAATSITIIRDRVLTGEPLRLHDLESLLKFIATPRLDKKTQNQLSLIIEKIAKGDYDKAYDKAIKKFSTEKSELIKVWQENKLMPSEAHQITITDIEKLSQIKNIIDRTTFLDVIKIIENDRTHQDQHYGKNRSRKQGDDDDRSRGGQSYLS